MNTLYALATAWAALTAPDLKWGDHYGAARKQAIANGKPLLVIVEAEKTLALGLPGANPIGNVSLTDVTASRELLSKYELCRIDGATEYGRRVAKAFKARELPLTAIVDKTGEWTVFVKTGELPAAELSVALSEWQTGVASAAFVKRMLERRRTSAFGSTEVRLCKT